MFHTKLLKRFYQLYAQFVRSSCLSCFQFLQRISHFFLSGPSSRHSTSKFSSLSPLYRSCMYSVHLSLILSFSIMIVLFFDCMQPEGGDVFFPHSSFTFWCIFFVLVLCNLSSSFNWQKNAYDLLMKRVTTYSTQEKLTGENCCRKFTGFDRLRNGVFNRLVLLVRWWMVQAGNVMWWESDQDSCWCPVLYWASTREVQQSRCINSTKLQ